MKLYVRDEIDETDKELKDLLLALQKIMEENVHTYMPGFTHLQKAQPVTLAHHVGAYFEMFRRDRDRLFDIRKRMNTCPLGAEHWQEPLIRWIVPILQSFSALMHQPETVWIPYLTEIMSLSFSVHSLRS